MKHNALGLRDLVVGVGGVKEEGRRREKWDREERRERFEQLNLLEFAFCGLKSRPDKNSGYRL